MSRHELSNLIAEYRMLNAALHLRSFSPGEVRSLARVSQEQADLFVQSCQDRRYCRLGTSKRLSLTSEGFAALLQEALVAARDLLRAAVKEEKERRIATSKFGSVLLIASRTEALLRGATPKVDLKGAKASRIAVEEVRLGLVRKEDLHAASAPEPEEEELHFTFGGEEEEDPPIRPEIEA